MPPAARTCPACGSARVVEDQLHCEAQLVCRDCGSVVSAGRLVSEPCGGTADVRYSHTTAVSKQPCRNQIRGLQRVRALCRILRLSFEIEELAEVYYRKAYAHASFIRVSLQKKEALVGCCVLVSCRLRNWPIALGTISCLLETDPTLVGGVYQELEKILDVEVPKTSVTYVLEAHSREYKLSSDHVPEELAETSQDLARRSVALVELAADSWIVTGRHPVPIMMASIFLSWQSLRPTKVRLKYSLNKFCRLSKMPINKTAVRRVGEMKEVLRKLGQEIPWLRAGGDVSPDDTLKHVEDILQHRYALLRHALRTHEETLGVRPGTDDPPPEAPCPPHRSERPPEPRQLKTVNGDPDEGGGDSGGVPEQHPAANWGKRMLFAPPCVRNPKTRRAEPAERAHVTGDEDISDSEIDSYIRTPQEVVAYIQTQQVLLSASRDGRSRSLETLKDDLVNLH